MVFDLNFAKQCFKEIFHVRRKIRETQDIEEKLAYTIQELKQSVLFSLRHFVLTASPPVFALLIVRLFGTSALFLNVAMLSAFVIIPWVIIIWGYALMYPRFKNLKCGRQIRRLLFTL